MLRLLLRAGRRGLPTKVQRSPFRTELPTRAPLNKFVAVPRSGALVYCGLIGETLDGKYRIVRLLQEGGMGCVYEAEQLDTSHRVAVKVINERRLAVDKNAVRRFRREARAVSAIGNRHIVQILDTGADEATGLSYIAMEYLSGEDLQQLIDRIGPLVPHAALQIMAQVLQGLMAAHAANIIHRDIKPANIFLALEPNGTVLAKLLDFGIAKIKIDSLQTPHTTNLTTTGGFLGSPLYMSPEQVQSSRDVDHRTDLWSLGSVLYCALAGRAPYQHLETLGQMLVAICASPPPPLHGIAPWVAPEVAALVDGALKTKPEERYPSAFAMFEALRLLLPQGQDGFEIREGMIRAPSPEERSAIAPKVSASIFSIPTKVIVNPPSEVIAAIRGDETTMLVRDASDTKAVLQHSEYYDILDALQSASWNKAEAARRLGMPVRTLGRKMKRLGIKKPDFGRRGWSG